MDDLNQQRLKEVFMNLIQAEWTLYMLRFSQNTPVECDIVRGASDFVGKAHAKLLAVERSLAGVPEPEKTR